jgi:hypothetical protein
MSPIGVSNVLGWHPAGSFEKSTHCPAEIGRPNAPMATAAANAAARARRYDERVRAFCMALVILALAASVSAKPEYTRKTTKACAFCHQPPGYNLNEAGKYYADHGYSLKGYKPPKPKPSH